MLLVGGVWMVLTLLVACDSSGTVHAVGEPTGEQLTTGPTDSEPTSVGPTACAEVTEREGDAALQGRPVLEVSQEACVASTHATAGAGTSVLRVRVKADQSVWVSATDPSGASLLEDTQVAAGDDQGVTVVPARSGEVLLRVRPVEPRVEPWAYDLGVTCEAGCELPFTRYPILLMHGLSGADDVWGVDYFYRVTETLDAAGVEVGSPGVAPFADSATRAGEWSSYLHQTLDRGHRRVNLLGHSQGGLDARILASPAGRNEGDLIASVTTLGTPHRGTPLADLTLLAFDGGLVDEASFEVLVSLFGSVLGLQPDDPEFVAAMEQIAESTMGVQDVALVDHPATWYGSWVGHSCGILEPLCISRYDGEVVDPLMAASYLLMWPRPSDGLVPVDSQTHGVELGELPADHADEIGQFADDQPDPFDHLAFYLGEVDRLEALGF